MYVGKPSRHYLLRGLIGEEIFTIAASLLPVECAALPLSRLLRLSESICMAYMFYLIMSA
jgi:hypothetical protein